MKLSRLTILTASSILCSMPAFVASAQEAEVYEAPDFSLDTMTLGPSDTEVLTPGSDWSQEQMPGGPQTDHDFTDWEPSYIEENTDIIILPDIDSFE